MKKNRNLAVIEAMETRRLFDVSVLTETLDTSTLPTSISDQNVLKGTLEMTITNNSGADEKDPGSLVSFVIASTPLDPPSLNFYILREEKANLSLAAGASKVFKLPVDVNLIKGRPTDGDYTVYALVVGSDNNYSQSDPGPALTVHAPVISLSETEKLLKVPDSTVAGAKFRVTDDVAITNGGSDPSTTALKIGIYLTPDGVPADGALMTMVTRKETIRAGKTVTVPVTIAALPTLGAGTYEFVTQVTQTNGTVTTTDPTGAPTITLTKPITSPMFSDSFIGSPDTTYAYEPLDGALQYLSKLKVEMAIKNTGTSADGDVVFTLFASSNPAFDSSAMEVGQVTLPNIDTPVKGTRTLYVSWGLTMDLENYSGVDVNDYFYVQVTDPAGDVTMARYPTTILAGGPPDGL